MHRGYTKNYRKRVDNPLYKKPLVWHFFDYCTCRANHSDTVIDFNGQPFELKRGSFIMSLSTAERDTGLTRQNIRTAIKNLENHKMIEKSTQNLTKQATLITICNYEFYQIKKEEVNTVPNKALTKCQQSTNKVLTTEKNVKNVKNVKNGKETYTESFLKLWEDYPNTSGSKTQSFANYKTAMKKLELTDDELYTAAINSSEKQKDEGQSDKYIYRLSNVLGKSYMNDLPDLLDYEKEEKPEYDPWDDRKSPEELDELYRQASV